MPPSCLLVLISDLLQLPCWGSELEVEIKLILELRYSSVTYRIYKGERNEWKWTRAEGQRVRKQMEAKSGVGRIVAGNGRRSNKQ